MQTYTKSITTFEEGVAWVVEELAMRMQEQTVIGLWEHVLGGFREDLIAIMKKNNPEIYKIHIYPCIKQVKKFEENI